MCNIEEQPLWLRATCSFGSRINRLYSGAVLALTVGSRLVREDHSRLGVLQRIGRVTPATLPYGICCSFGDGKLWASVLSRKGCSII